MELLELVKIVPIIRKYIRVPDGTRINKQTNKQLIFFAIKKFQVVIKMLNHAETFHDSCSV
jgi:hypothetical protein